MQEDGWAGLRDESGVIQEESLMALRVNLLFDTPDTQTNVLVSLTQAAPDGGDSLLAAAVRRLSQRLDLPLPEPRVAGWTPIATAFSFRCSAPKPITVWSCWHISKTFSLRCSRTSRSGLSTVTAGSAGPKGPTRG